MSVLVTGATGRIGRHFIPALLSRGGKVRVLVRDGRKARELWGGSVEIAIGDITDAATVAKAAEGCDTIYHLAALLDFDAPRGKMFRVNVEGTRNVLDAAKGKKIIHLSSASVYGKKARSPISEQTPFSPTDVYGQSKAAADNLATAAGAVVLRPTVVYGPDMLAAFSKLFGLVRKGRMVIAGKGNNRIQWTHIDDLVSALLLSSASGRRGEAYNIVGDDVKTQREFLALIALLLGVPAPSRRIPLWFLRTFGRLLVKKSFVDTIAADRLFDCSKAKRELDWHPKVGYEQGIRGMLEN